MKKLSCFMAGLCLMLLAIPALAQLEDNFPYKMAARQQDFVEFEGLVSRPKPWITDKALIPNYRAMVIMQAKRFEAFLEKYPESPLKPEALFRAATLYLSVERQEVHAFRQELFLCKGIALEQGDERKLDICQQRFMLSVASIGGIADPIYERLARKVFGKLVEQYPHVKRYLRFADGEFSFSEDEEIGALALYILAQGMMLEDKRVYYETIIREYKIRPELMRDIQNRLGIH